MISSESPPSPSDQAKETFVRESSSSGRSACEVGWIAHPVRDRPRRQVVVLALLLVGVPVLVGFNFPSLVWPLLAFAILLASTARFFLPTVYRLDAEGVRVRFLGYERFYRWATFRRFESHPHGLFLSPFPTPRRLDNYRGLYLLRGRETRGRTEAEAEAFIRRHLAAARNADRTDSPSRSDSASG